MVVFDGERHPVDDPTGKAHVAGRLTFTPAD